MIYPHFIGGSYESQAVTAAQMRTVNLYEERVEDPGGTTRKALYPTPGAELLGYTPSTDGRAHAFVRGREFAVIGNTLVEIPSNVTQTTITFLGFVAVDTHPATISSNGDGGGEIFITSGGNGYIFDLTTGTFSQIAALNGKASMGDAIDGYFLALDRNTSTLYVSELLDGLTWTTGTMFAQRTAGSDPWIALKVAGSYIWLMGPETSEVWYNAGSSPFPFAKHPSGLVQWGTAAAFSAVVCDASLVWLGSSRGGRGFVLRAAGFQPEPVSSYPAQLAMSGYTTVGDAYADTYNEAGHTFYVLSFPTADATWVYDIQTGAWHERGAWDPANNAFSVWRPRCHAFAYGEHRWLHATGTGLYRLSIDLGSDVDGLPIRRMRRAPALMVENERLFYSGFELDVEPGLGLSTGQGSAPMAMLRTSRDGGKTWGPEWMRSAGKAGEYGARLRWNRLGAARRMTFEVTVSDPIPWRVTNAYLQMGETLPNEQRRTA